jgi:uncharacterized membrane protein
MNTMSLTASSSKLRLQGPWRRVAYVTLYEIFAVAATSFGLSAMTGESASHSTVIATVTAAIAVAWNVIWNSLFERWEARQAQRGRSLWRRIAHALGMEGGLVVMLVPLFAWWFDVGLWQAFIMDLWLLLYFLVYTFVFNWTFDRIFGLPASAQLAAAQVAA